MQGLPGRGDGGIERMPTIYEAEVLKAFNDALWEAS